MYLKLANLNHIDFPEYKYEVHNSLVLNLIHKFS